MTKFEHDDFKYFVKEHVGKGMMVQMLQDGILKLLPFVVWWIFQTEEDMCKLGAIENHIPPWNGVGKER